MTRKAKVNSLLVSDSVLIWTDDSKAESFVHIVNAVRSLIAFSLIDRILLRGAISVGPLTMMLNQWPSQTHSFQHSLFGKAIVEAVEAEKTQDWIGCKITDEAMAQYQQRGGRGDELTKKKLVVQYSIPSKHGEQMGYAVDWVNHAQTAIDFETVIGSFSPTPKTPLKAFESKLKNTLKFVKQVKPSSDQPRVLSQFHFTA